MGDYTSKDGVRTVNPAFITGPDRYRGLPPFPCRLIGRTLDSGSGYLGSSPSGGSNHLERYIMNKVFTTLALFVTLTTSAAADPLSDFFGGLFGGQSQSAQTSKGKNRHGKSISSRYDNNSDGDYAGSHSGGSRMVASFYGHGERLSRHKIGRAHV